MEPHKTSSVIKSDGEKVYFSKEKIRRSLANAGASEIMIEEIIQKISQELYSGISTQEIHNRAFNLLKGKNRITASKYKLKKAIYELGPTGYPFERFIAAILQNSGYHVSVGQTLQGECVSHEVDVIASNPSEHILVECKFHGETGRNCNVKIPLYIHSRFRDLQRHQKSSGGRNFTQGWVATNTRFTTDAMTYGRCVGLYLLSWNSPKGASLKERIDKAGLYPITVSTLLSKREKCFLMDKNVVLCKELLKYDFLLDHLNISDSRKRRLIEEMQSLTMTN